LPPFDQGAPGYTKIAGLGVHASKTIPAAGYDELVWHELANKGEGGRKGFDYCPSHQFSNDPTHTQKGG
jgi:hypothetical protein